MRAKQFFFGSVGTVISVGAGGTQVFNAGGGAMVIGSGKSIVQQRDLGGSFDALEVTGSAGIEVRRADHCVIEVHGEDNLIDFLETELVGTTLQVGIKRGVNFTSHLPLKVFATAPTVSEVDLSGSGDVRLFAVGNALRVHIARSLIGFLLFVCRKIRWVHFVVGIVTVRIVAVWILRSLLGDENH